MMHTFQPRLAALCTSGVPPVLSLDTPRAAASPRSRRAPLIAAAAIAGALAGLGACGGSDDDVMVTLSPPVANIAAGETVQFTATVIGSSNTKVNWGASGGSISATGLYTAPPTGGGYAIRATAAANSHASATSIVNVTGEGSVLEPFYDSQTPYVQVMTPMPFATYFAPATIRIWAHAPDSGNDNVKGYSPLVEFYLGTMMVGSSSASQSGASDYYQVDVTGVPAGSYEVVARSRMASGAVDSVRIPITVVDVPSGGPTMNLTSDLVLSGNTSFELVGSASARAVLTSSNGSRIRSMPGWNGHFTLKNADVIGLGSMDMPGLDIAVRGTNAIEITDSVFDRCGPPIFTASDQAPITLKGNTFQPNTLTPVNEQANYAGSHPSLVLAGASSAPKLFQGNNVGVSFVRFDRSSHWMIGGDRDADGNVFLGVRAGIEIDQASDITIRGNFSYHRYPFGWSQGHNLDFIGDSSGVLVEHNVFRSSSWMIQSLPPNTNFQFNLLVDNINEAFFRSFGSSVKVHHNVLVNAGFQRVFLPSGGVLIADGAFYNNTVDVGGQRLGWVANAFMPSDGQHHLSSVRNNVFAGFAYQSPTDVIASGAATLADYNCFYNPDTNKLTRYGSGGGLGSHDCGAGNSTDPKFAQSRVIPFPIADGDVWRRKITVSQILALYRGIYTPMPGSPLIDAGDPNDDTGGDHNADIGAVGAGASHPDDRFGRFGM